MTASKPTEEAEAPPEETLLPSASPTIEALKARGFREVKGSGKGYGLPWPGPVPKAKPPTREELEALGIEVVEPSGKEFIPGFIPPMGPAPRE